MLESTGGEALWTLVQRSKKMQEKLTCCFVSQKKILSFFLLLLQKQPFRVPETNPTVFCCSSSLCQALFPQQLPLCSTCRSSHSSEELSSFFFLLLLLTTSPSSSASLSPTPRHDEHPQPLVFYHFGGWFAITCSNFPL